MSIWERYAHIGTSNGYQIDLYKNDLMYKHTARLADSAHLGIRLGFSTTRLAGFAYLKNNK